MFDELNYRFIWGQCDDNKAKFEELGDVDTS